MIRTMRLIGLVLVVSAFPHMARADVEVVVIDGSGTLTVTHLQEVNGKWQVAFTAEGTPSITVAVQADDEDIIEYIDVESNSAGGTGRRVELVTRTKPTTSGRIVRIENIRITSNDPHDDGELWLLDVFAEITSTQGEGVIGYLDSGLPAGVVEAHRIISLRAETDMLASISAINTIGNSRGIDLIEAEQYILSPRIETDGRLGRIQAWSIGNIGYPSPLGFQIEATGEVGNVECTVFFASLTVLGASSNTGLIRRFDCGNYFFGVVSCDTFTDDVPGAGDPGFFVAGEFAAGYLFVAGDLETPIELDSFAGGSVIWIGGTLTAATADMLLIASYPNAALGGLIVVNGNDDGGEWLGTVVAGGGVSLSPNSSQPNQAPYYERLASELGGGSVALAPFRMHKADCYPPDGSCFQGGIPGNTVVIRYYGPVTWASGTPLTVEISANISACDILGGPWTDITNDFEFYLDAKGRDIIVDPKNPILDFDGPLAYRIRPTSNLKCELVTGAPTVHPQDEYLVVINH